MKIPPSWSMKIPPSWSMKIPPSWSMKIPPSWSMKNSSIVEHENSSIIMGHENHLYSNYKIVWNAPKEGKKLIIKIYSPSKVFGMLHTK
jgi:hypothetical protein